MRVIFDRSAFHGDRFDRLNQSPLADLVRRGRLTVYHTPILLDETKQSYGKDRAGGEWRQHLAFMLDICNGGYFLPKNHIWHNELVIGQGPHAEHLMPGRRRRRYYGGRTWQDYVQMARRAIASGDLDNVWHDTQDERDEVQTKKSAQRQTAAKMRHDVSTARRQGLLQKKDQSLQDYLAETVPVVGRTLMPLVHPSRAGQLACQWAARPARYPYFTAFATGAAYWSYHAAVETNSALDRNAQSDYEHLAYLVWADVVVSNDMGFQLDAFNALWRPRGKRFETAESFAKLCAAL